MAQLTPLKAIKCTYDDCYHSFDNPNELRAHLTDRAKHPFYCGKTPSAEKIARGFVPCNFHGKCWEDVLVHKVESMMPWLVGKKRYETPKKLAHIVCEFCGVDFGSLSGREAHRKQMHQAEQHIVCRGYVHVRDIDGNLVKEECGMVMGRASQLIRHIEGGFCAYIRPKTFQEQRQHKEIIKKILQDPEAFKANNQPKPIKQPAYTPSLDQTTDGGVDVLLDNIETMSIGSFESIATIRTTYVETAPDAQSRFPHIIVERDSGCSSPTYSHSLEPSTWADSNSSSSLLDGDSAQPSQYNWIARDEANKGSLIEDEAADDKFNIFHARWYDPNHGEFCPEMFHRPVENDSKVPPYSCPFPQCEHRFLTAPEAGEHVRYFHAELKNICAICCKEFDKLSGLVAHCEASSQGGKCFIARTSTYAQFLFDVTGGFVSATKTEREPVHGYKIEAITKPSKAKTIKYNPEVTRESGVKDYDYSAEPPSRPAFTQKGLRFDDW